MGGSCHPQPHLEVVLARDGEVVARIYFPTHELLALEASATVWFHPAIRAKLARTSKPQMWHLVEKILNSMIYS